MSKLLLKDNTVNLSNDIIMVDDDELDFIVTQRSFKMSYLENEMHWMDSGEKLINHLFEKDPISKDKNTPPLLIFLDVSMPIKDGKETIDEIKKHTDISKFNIVLLTGSDQVSIQQKGLGDFPYIRKPLTFEKLYNYILNSDKFILHKTKKQTPQIEEI